MDEESYNHHSPWIAETSYYGWSLFGVRLIRHSDNETSIILYVFGRPFILGDT
jgi:hypothetical protein